MCTVFMEFNLKKVLLALLYSTSEPIAPKEIQKLCARYRLELEVNAEAADESAAEADIDEDTPSRERSGGVPSLVTQTQIREAFDALQREADASEAAYRIIEGPAGYQLAAAPEYAAWVRLLRGDPPPIKLSPAAMETVAIVAYRQPVTRAEMESIRGVSIDSALNRLVELELVHATGRADLPGRPIQYGTTDRFLEFCGVTSLEALPASDVLSNRQIDDWIRRLNSGEEAENDDQAVGLPKERKQGELPLEEKFIEFDQFDEIATNPGSQNP